jgi:hypothetical protein
VVFLGFALARGTPIVASCVALGAFALGAALGGGLARRGRLRAALGLELGLLGAAAALASLAPGSIQTLVALLGAAMGLRNAVARHLAVADLTTTVLTLTVAGLAADSRLAGGSAPRQGRRLAAVAVMLLGAWAGAALLRLGVGATLGVAAAVEAAAIVTLVRSLPGDAAA